MAARGTRWEMDSSPRSLLEGKHTYSQQLEWGVGGWGRKGGGAKEEWFGCGRGVWWGSLGSRIQTEGFISSVTSIAQRLPRAKCCSWEMGRACASDHDGMRWRGKG